MQPATGSAIGKSMSRNGGFQLGLSSKNLFHHKENRVSGLTHGDDFVLTGPTKRLTEFENEMTSVYPIKAKIISLGSPKSIKTLNRRLHWERKESCTNMIPDTLTCL